MWALCQGLFSQKGSIVAKFGEIIGGFARLWVDESRIGGMNLRPEGRDSRQF